MKPLNISPGLLVALVALTLIMSVSDSAWTQTRRPRPAPAKPRQQPAPRGPAAKYSAFLHSSDSHKNLACNACHKVPTEWSAKRNFPDVADFPDHDACVRCHRRQFFTREAFSGTGPAICTVCHVRTTPRDDARFAFGSPNNADQTRKPKDERQFTIEFPHDKHQNVIARLAPVEGRGGVSFLRASFTNTAQQKPAADYNNCTICHQPNVNQAIVPLTLDPAAPQLGRFFKSMPDSHAACFDCHWKSQEPVGTNCAGCHKPANTFVKALGIKRISMKFSHEGGAGEHVQECTSCHINITRSSTLRGLTPDVPITICATCHKDSKKTTYPKMTTIEDELAKFKKTGECTYCHTPDVGKRKAPPSHEASVQ